MPSPPERRTLRIRWATRLAWVVAGSCLLTMFIGTHLPSISMPGFSMSDKVLHCGAFIILTMCLLTSWELTTGPLFATHQSLVALLCAVYGAFDEITQIPVGRSCDLFDWFADVLGIAVGVLLFRYVRPLLYRLVLRIPQPSTVA